MTEITQLNTKDDIRKELIEIFTVRAKFDNLMKKQLTRSPFLLSTVEEVRETINGDRDADDRRLCEYATQQLGISPKEYSALRGQAETTVANNAVPYQLT
jgi:hypothetical protein